MFDEYFDNKLSKRLKTHYSDLKYNKWWITIRGKYSPPKYFILQILF